jgi:predicted RNase H-like HicB family nuclease
MILNAIIEKDDFGYFAQIPELKGCVTQGKTYEETLANIQEAAELYLESLKIEELRALQRRKVSISPIEVAIHA